MDKSLLEEFQLDWTLAGKSEQTAKNYVRGIELLLEDHSDSMLVDV